MRRNSAWNTSLRVRQDSLLSSALAFGNRKVGPPGSTRLSPLLLGLLAASASSSWTVFDNNSPVLAWRSRRCHLLAVLSQRLGKSRLPPRCLMALSSRFKSRQNARRKASNMFFSFGSCHILSSLAMDISCLPSKWCNFRNHNLSGEMEAFS